MVAHEIAHSWTGNLVTNKTWEHFWLNEVCLGSLQYLYSQIAREHPPTSFLSLPIVIPSAPCFLSPDVFSPCRASRCLWSARSLVACTASPPVTSTVSPIPPPPPRTRTHAYHTPRLSGPSSPVPLTITSTALSSHSHASPDLSLCSASHVSFSDGSHWWSEVPS